jgi:sulfate adenylyltransferase subunit 1
VTVLPSGSTTKISGIDLLGKPVRTAWTTQSVTILLEDDIDVSRGDLIVPSKDAPATTQDIEATVCHVADAPLTVGHRVLLKHGTRTVKAIVKDIPSRLTLDDLSLHPHPGQLVANDIGRVKIRTAEPLPVDSYADSRRTGSFILIDPADGTTLTAGMVGESFAAPEPVKDGTDDDGWDF